MNPTPCSNNPVSALLVAYEREFLRQHTLDDVLDYPKMLQGDPFVVSGLYDLRAALCIVDDHYRNHVKLDWRPLETRAGTYNTLWGESNGQKVFTQSFVVPTYVRQERREFKRGAVGEVSTQPATMVLPITHLWRVAYLPKIGDQVRYRSTRYEVLAAYANPEHYWQNTGFPLYWTCDMGIAPQDSRFLDCSETFEFEPGAPSMEEPGGEPMPNGEPD